VPFDKVCRECKRPFTTRHRHVIFCGRKCCDTYRTGKPRSTLQELLYDKIQHTDGCWFWLGVIDKKSGYGHAYTGIYGIRRHMWAHEFAYHVLVGPVPPGLEIDHKCRVRHCVRPDHLEPVTHAENMRRGVEARTCCGQGHPRTPENTSYTPRGNRRCIPCDSAKRAAYTKCGRSAAYTRAWRDRNPNKLRAIA
jgi:hypothetical protein